MSRCFSSMVNNTVEKDNITEIVLCFQCNKLSRYFGDVEIGEKFQCRFTFHEFDNALNYICSCENLHKVNIEFGDEHEHEFHCGSNCTRRHGTARDETRRDDTVRHAHTVVAMPFVAFCSYNCCRSDATAQPWSSRRCYCHNNNRTIKDLDLTDVKCDVNTPTVLCNMLLKNKSLQTVNFSENLCFNNDDKNLSEIVLHNNTITELYLDESLDIRQIHLLAPAIIRSEKSYRTRTRVYDG